MIFQQQKMYNLFKNKINIPREHQRTQNPDKNKNKRKICSITNKHRKIQNVSYTIYAKTSKLRTQKAE